MQDMPAQKPRQAIRKRGITHDFLRASIMMVDPARQAASTKVNGRAAITKVPQPFIRYNAIRRIGKLYINMSAHISRVSKKTW